MNSFIQEHEEKNLLDRLKLSDAEAFETIYNHYWKKLFAVAANKLQDLAEAEEVVQDIFMDLWRRRETLNITTCLSSYLSASVKYKVINVLARRHQQLRYQTTSAQQNSASDCSTEHVLRFEELKEELIKETAKLPEKCRLVFQLSRDEGFSQKQIAIKLGISEKTVEAHLSKAIRTLRAGL